LGVDDFFYCCTVTAQSTAHEPPEDGRKYGPKHVGATEIKCFKNAIKCFKY